MLADQMLTDQMLDNCLRYIAHDASTIDLYQLRDAITARLVQDATFTRSSPKRMKIEADDSESEEILMVSDGKSVSRPSSANSAPRPSAATCDAVAAPIILEDDRGAAERSAAVPQAEQYDATPPCVLEEVSPPPVEEEIEVEVECDGPALISIYSDNENCSAHSYRNVKKKGYDNSLHPENPRRIEYCEAGITLAGPIVERFSVKTDPDAANAAVSQLYQSTIAHRVNISYGEEVEELAATEASIAAAVSIVLRAVDDAEPGSRSFSLTRPPGHHAGDESDGVGAHGFCFVNTVAIAAVRALCTGYSRVAIGEYARSHPHHPHTHAAHARTHAYLSHARSPPPLAPRSPRSRLRRSPRRWYSRLRRESQCEAQLSPRAPRAAR